MIQNHSRYTAASSPNTAEGWTLERLMPASRLFGANGMCTGPDGRVYVAQCLGSQISALSVDTGELETISPIGGDIVGPDDLVFDDRGALYVTEPMDGRVSVRDVDGGTRVLRDDVPGANGVTMHQGRLFVDECRLDGRLLELDLNGGAPRVLLENLQLPNALAAGPDGRLYFPLVGAGEIWRVHPDEGRAERVVAGLSHPVAVKFDARGFIVSPQSGTGEVLRIDPRNGDRTVLARLEPCLDNLAFVNDRLFVSHHVDGRITEILGEGKTREVTPGGLQFPLGVAMGEDGELYIADNSSMYALAPGGMPRRIGWMFGAGFPGSARGLARAAEGGFLVTTSDGRLVIYWPTTQRHDVLASGLDELYGVALGRRGQAVAVECGAGRVLSIDAGGVSVLATGLRKPMGVAILADGCCLVSETGAGRVIKVTEGGVETVLDGLQEPQGLAVHEGCLYVVDARAQQLIAFDMNSKVRRIIASDLPIGVPPGVTARPLRGMPPFSGPLGRFAGIAAASDGSLYVSADAEGSVITLRPTDGGRRD